MIRALTLPLLLVLLGPLSLATPAAAQDMDIAKLVSAPGYVYLGEGIKLGYRMERETTVAGTKMREFMAVVGETKDAWEIESTQGLGAFKAFPGGEGIILALVVDKKSLAVLSARVGKPGGALEDVRILEQAKGPKDTEKPKPDRIEEFKFKSGKTIEVEVYVSEIQGKTFTSKVGKKGTPYEGVLMNNEGAPGPGSFVLSEDPSEGKLKLEDTDAEGKPKSIDTITVSFTNGYTYTYSQNAIAKAFFGQVVKIASEAFTMRVVSLKTDAKKTLTWK
jgi:hypothetical protein